MSEVQRYENSARALALSLLALTGAMDAGCKAKASGDASVETQNPSDEEQNQAAEQSAQAEGQEGEYAKATVTSRAELVPPAAEPTTEEPTGEPTPPKSTSNKLSVQIDLGNLKPGAHEINVVSNPEDRVRLLAILGQLGGTCEYTVGSRDVKVTGQSTDNEAYMNSDAFAIRVKNNGKVTPGTTEMMPEVIEQCEKKAEAKK